MSTVFRSPLLIAVIVSFTLPNVVLAGDFSAQDATDSGLQASVASALPDSIAVATPTTTVESEIDLLSTQILLKELDLARFYTSYRIIGTEEPRSRHLRYFVAQEAAAGLFLSAALIPLIESADGLKNPDRVSVPAGKHSTVQGVVASILEGGSSGIELGSNMLLTAKHKRLKQDPRSAMEEVLKRLKEIESLMSHRSKLVTGYEGRMRAVHVAEGKTLSYFRDLCIYEFADIFADVKGFQASSNVYYIMDVAGCSVYVASYLLGLKGFSKFEYNGPSSITGIVGDAIFIPSGPLTTIAYNKLYSHWWNKFSQRLGQEIEDPKDRAQASVRVLDELFHREDSVLCKHLHLRLQIYDYWADHNNSLAERREMDLRRTAKVSRQSDVSGPLIGAGYLASDILGTNTSYRLANNDKATNSNTFAGSIPAALASVTSLGLTTAWFIGDEKHKRYLRKHHALPSQMYAERLRVLKAFEQHLLQH